MILFHGTQRAAYHGTRGWLAGSNHQRNESPRSQLFVCKWSSLLVTEIGQKQGSWVSWLELLCLIPPCSVVHSMVLGSVRVSG